MTLPFEFTVEGPPVSLQGNPTRRAAWKSKVAAAATAAMPIGASLVTEDVELSVIYYHESATLDMDNMVKPIQDALIGIVYSDDSCVSDVSARRRSLYGSFKVRGLSVTLAMGFTTGIEFLHISVTAAPDPAVIQ